MREVRRGEGEGPNGRRGFIGDKGSELGEGWGS